MMELSEVINNAIREWADDPDTVGFEIYHVLGNDGVSELSSYISTYITDRFLLKTHS